MNQPSWQMNDEGAIRMWPGESARRLRSESPLFMATARERNASLGIEQGPTLFDDPPTFEYSIKTIELTPWN